MAAQLEYAATPRRRVRWRWIALAALLVLGVVGWRYGKDVTAQAKLRWAVHKCTSYTRPADSIAYEGNPDFAKKMARLDSAYVILPQSRWSRLDGAYRAISEWNALPIPRTRWQINLYRVSGPATPAPAIPLFLHTRASNGRPERLVAVEFTSDGLEGYVIDPGPLWGKPKVLWQGAVRNLGEDIPATFSRGRFASGPANWEGYIPVQSDDAVSNVPPARVYFGQVDPKNSAKFTIRVAVCDTEFVFEGQLMPDDTVQVEGPLLSEVLAKIRDAKPKVQYFFDIGANLLPESGGQN